MLHNFFFFFNIKVHSLKQQLIQSPFCSLILAVSGQGEGLRTVQLSSKTMDNKTDSKIRHQNNAAAAFNRTATDGNIDPNFSNSLKVTKRPAVSKPMGPVRVKFGYANI